MAAGPGFAGPDPRQHRRRRRERHADHASAPSGTVSAGTDGDRLDERKRRAQPGAEQHRRQPATAAPRPAPSVSTGAGDEVPLAAIAHLGARADAAGGQPPEPIRRRDDLVQSRPRQVAERRTGGDRPGHGRRCTRPATLHGSFAGTAQAFQQSLASEPILIAAALLAVYIVLGVLYESLVHPVTILSTLPSAGVGAVAALLLTGTEFSIIALIGLVLLIGIVKKNAILMIDFALHAERDQAMTAARRDLPGRRDPVPPDPDDHAGRPAGCGAAGDQLRRGRRDPAAARHRHHRRPAREPVAHALHHAGPLHATWTGSASGPPASGAAPSRNPHRSPASETVSPADSACCWPAARSGPTMCARPPWA